MEELKRYLEEEPRARERSQKDRGIVNVLLKRYPDLASLDKTMLTEFVREHNNMDRSWRKILEENPSLRGSDYNEKTKLEQQKQIELGYEPGYNQDLQLGRKYS